MIDPASRLPGPSTPTSSARSRTLLLAHRGDHRRSLENSLPALTAAIGLAGVDGVEFDVRLSREGVPVVIHDATLLRVQGDPRRVTDLRAAELEQLGVPALADVLALLPRHTFLDVELKDDAGRAAVEVLAAGRGPSLARAVVSSFDAQVLRHVGSLAPAWPRWLNTVDLDRAVVRRARELGCAGIAAEWHAIRPETVHLAQKAGLELSAWTVTRRPTLARLMRLGLAALCVEGAALGSGRAAR